MPEIKKKYLYYLVRQEVILLLIKSQTGEGVIKQWEVGRIELASVYWWDGPTCN